MTTIEAQVRALKQRYGIDPDAPVEDQRRAMDALDNRSYVALQATLVGLEEADMGPSHHEVTLARKLGAEVESLGHLRAEAEIEGGI